MEKKGFSILPGLAKNTMIFVFPYAGSKAGIEYDKPLFHTELEKHLLYNPGIAEYGMGVTGSDLTISDDAGTGRTIELASGDITTEVAQHPVVFYKGTPIPFSDYDNIINTKGEITLKSGTTTTYPSTSGADYEVWYSDHLWEIVQSLSLGGIELPIESSEYSAVGHGEPVYRVVKRGEQSQSGSITVVEDMQSLMYDGGTAPKNSAGEELLYRIFGSSEWSKGAGLANPNLISPPSNPFGIAALMLSGNSLGGNQGEIWAVAQYVYHCELTNVGEPQNVTGDSTDPILRTIEFDSFYGKSGITVVRVPA
jgi:hypothetical protein